EAGDPYTYVNGGVWFHGNAWYALALMANGEKISALNFIKDTMTLEGILNSPNGQIAMYEYRNGNYRNPGEYGVVQNPQFLWAGGWYLYSLYHLFGISENSWNISFDPFLYDRQKICRFDIFAGGKLLDVRVSGNGRHVKEIRYSGKFYPSAVIPENLPDGKNVEIIMGTPESPYLFSTNSILVSCFLNRENKTLNAKLRAFKGHKNRTEFILLEEPEQVLLNGEPLKSRTFVQEEDVYRLILNFVHESDEEDIVIEY
ncbi:MAG: hypothetical protein J7M18_03440, partial [Candidatus Eremiobacteraeota bacterium]|nr:hypothetical protein [Candidatus Eremiobacteraeota bacterium]